MNADREAMREVLADYYETSSCQFTDEVLDRLKACVTSDEFAGQSARDWAIEESRQHDLREQAEAKLIRVEALCVRWERYPYMVQIVDDVRVVLRGES